MMNQRAEQPDFGRAPWLVIWETTRACDLACLHCRAEAVPGRDPRELGTEEAKRLLRTIREFGRPLVVLTGGDPLKRPDVVELVGYGSELGLRMAMTPSGTPLMTPEILSALKRAGLKRLAVSVDGSSAAIHDAFRGVAGSYDWTLAMLRHARELGLPTQVNTTVSRYNLDDFDGLCALMTELGIVLWSVFFLVPTGRARAEDVADAEAFEAVFHRMYALSQRVPFDIKSTAAPQYRRVVVQREVSRRRAGAVGSTVSERPTGGPGFTLGDGVERARGVNDGDGFVFVAHDGEIYPSGFLPVSAGNVRTADLVAVYRTSPLFVALRDRDRLRGKCGVCEYRAICGGSRARAYATTGDWLESDPYCAHEPSRWRRMVANGEAEPTAEYFARRMRGFGTALPVMAGTACRTPEGR
jgi:AdoMet-dependent heme synthase